MGRETKMISAELVDAVASNAWVSESHHVITS
jgi:hypothetical protein